MRDDDSPKAGVARLFRVIRELSVLPSDGGGLTHIARACGLTQATTHRLLHSLAAEGMVEHDAQRRLYRLSVECFALGLQASHPGELRLMSRPALRRLSASLGESVYLLAHGERDVVCIDRVDSVAAMVTSHPVVEIGARIALAGDATGTLAILAFLPEAEREAVLRACPPSPFRGSFDLRVEVDRVRRAGHAARRGHGHADPASAAVPIVDRGGRAVASLVVDTIAERLDIDRLPMVIESLEREAAAIGPGIAPFDALRQPPASARAEAPSRRTALLRLGTVR